MDGDGLKRYVHVLTLALTSACAIQATTVDIIAPGGNTEHVYNAVGFTVVHTAAGGVFSVTLSYVDDQPILAAPTDIGPVKDLEYDLGGLPSLNVPITGFGMDEDIRRSLDAGFNAHLTKPVNFERLESLMAQFAPNGWS